MIKIERLTTNQEKILGVIEIYHPYSEITTKLQGDNLVICEYPYDCANEEWSYDEARDSYIIRSNESKNNIEIISKTEIKLRCEFDYDRLDEIASSLSFLKRSGIIDKQCLKQIISSTIKKYEQFFKSNKYEPLELVDEYPEVNRIIEEILHY